METRRITVLSAGLGVPSSSRLLADQLAAAAERQLAAAGYAVTVDVVELRDLAVDIANNFVTGYAAPRLAEVIAGVEASDGIIAVSPVFSASYSGLFKSFIDVLDPKSLEGKAVLLGRHRRNGPPPDGAGLRHAAAVQLPAHPDGRHGRLRRPPGLGKHGRRRLSPFGARSSGRRASLPACWTGASPAAEAGRRWSRCLLSSCWPGSPPRGSRCGPVELFRRPTRSLCRVMKCPVDSLDLIMSERSGVEIDYCPQCRGVWLDRGELDKIIDRAADSLGRSRRRACRRRVPATGPASSPRPGHIRRRCTNHDPRRDDRRRMTAAMTSAGTTSAATVRARPGKV